MMKARLLLALAAAALALPPSAAPAQRAQAAQQDWSRTVVRTPAGYRIGNPDAPVKLIEYGSISCSHCAEFSAEASAALRSRYIGPGRISLEYRPYLIFPTDPGAFMLLNCLPPQRFFTASEQLYASQAAWFGRVQALSQAERARIAALPEKAQVAAYVRAAGLDRFFRGQGLSAAQINRCLGDEAGYRRLLRMNEEAERIGVRGTPTFVVNGLLVGNQHWATLEPMIQPPQG